MADVKISGLPASTVPLAGTEVLPVVQGGVTKQVSVDNLTAGKAVSALSVTATTVNGTTFDTNVAAAGVTLAGTTLAADGTDANINISLVPKGTGQVVVNAGTAALPAVAPTGDPNTGILFPAADTIAFAEGGTESMRIDSTGRAIIGASSSTLTFSSAQSRLQLAGNDFQTASASIICNAATDQLYGLYVAQTGATIGNNFSLGLINFGAGTNSSARITAAADGAHTAGTSTPGRLVFATTASAAANVTERMRLTSDGYLRMASGSLGIQFNGDTAAANALNDYEEGTWTPAITFGGAAVGVTYGTRVGRYTKIGNSVSFVFNLTLTSKGSSAGAAVITGLPFTSNASGQSAISVGYFADFLALTGAPCGRIGANSTSLIISQTSSTTAADLFNTHYTDTTFLIVSGQYNI
jgi:hypothetical protein